MNSERPNHSRSFEVKKKKTTSQFTNTDSLLLFQNNQNQILKNQ
jgi:hypothetical protein